MHLLGHNLPDHKVVRVALTSFYGISYYTSARLLARLQIHHECRVHQLTEPQVTALSAFLSSPSTTAKPAPTPLSIPPPPPHSLQLPSTSGKQKVKSDPLDNLKIETELQRSVTADMAHHRLIGTYRGRRMAAGLPVRGQRTRTNAQTARRLNRPERRHFTTAISTVGLRSGASLPQSLHPFSSSKILSALRSLS